MCAECRELEREGLIGTVAPAVAPVAVPVERTPFTAVSGRAPVTVREDAGLLERKLAGDLAMLDTSQHPLAEFMISMALDLARSADELLPSDIRPRIAVTRELRGIIADLTKQNKEAKDDAPQEDSALGVDVPDSLFGPCAPEIFDHSAIDENDPCKPLLMTRRRYERPTWGPYWGRVAAALGRPYMPWQQEVANLAGEVDERGRLCYFTVLTTVPRQSGKTTLVLPVMVGRAEAGEAFGGRQSMVYAAQSGTAARKKWERDYVHTVERAKCMAGRTKTRRSADNPGLTFLSSDTVLSPIPTQEESAHGDVLDFGALDEAFSQKDNRVPAAWRPAMSTRPMAQMWFYSTKGDVTAQWFLGELKKGREAVKADTGMGLAFIEFAAPADTPPREYGNPELWKRVMPALGRTQSVEFIRGEYEAMGLNDFRRAYLNQDVDEALDQVLPAEQWSRMVRTVDDAVRSTRPVLVYDVSYDQRTASIAIGFELADGTVAVRVAENGTGTSWLVDRILALRDELEPVVILADDHGPVREITAKLRAEYVLVETTNTAQMAEACSMIFSGVDDEGFVHYGEPELNKAVQGAGKRELGDGWAWTRKRSLANAGTDISPLVAVTLAYWGQVTMGDHVQDGWEDSFG